MKLKKKILFGIFSIIVVIAISGIVYVISGSATRNSNVLAYLEDKGYSSTEIRSVDIEHSFMNIILSYREWIAYVEFEDEIGIIYHYYFDESKISQGSFTGDRDVYGDLEKEEILEKLKHWER